MTLGLTRFCDEANHLVHWSKFPLIINGLLSKFSLSSSNPLPIINYEAISFLKRYLLPSHNVIEYGSGYSSLWYSQRVHRVVSVEDNQAWLDYLAPTARLYPNLSIDFHSKPQSYSTFFTNYPDLSPDLVVIDGSVRNLCTIEILNHFPTLKLLYIDDTDKFSSLHDQLSYRPSYNDHIHLALANARRDLVSKGYIEYTVRSFAPSSCTVKQGKFFISPDNSRALQFLP